MGWVKRIFFLFYFLDAGQVVRAQPFSYVYIQGDKETPFYVKYEDEMLPRYGKNYCIISQLAPGPMHIKILFQQNEYPAQDFYIQVPENGSRSFLIHRKNNFFQLYDTQQDIYLNAGDKEADRMPEKTTTQAITPTRPLTTVTAAESSSGKPATLLRQPKPSRDTLLPPPEKKDPVFINDIELRNEHKATGINPVVPTNK